MYKPVKIGLIGNPNVGKTTFLNTLTGLNQHVGNWPGKTVEKIVGTLDYQNYSFEVTDLPGTYSLSAYTDEERISRDFLLFNTPDIVVNIIDAETLERNLYLTLQTLALVDKVVIVLNMMNRARQRGIEINPKKLSKHLGVPVIAYEANSKEGLDAVLETIIAVSEERIQLNPLKLTFNPHMESNINAISSKILNPGCHGCACKRWIAVKLLEKDEDVRCALGDCDELLAVKQADKIHDDELHHDPAIEIAGRRYDIIADIVAKSSTRKVKGQDPTERIDNILIHRWIGIPLLFTIFGLVFLITFTLSTPIMDAISTGLEMLGELVNVYFSGFPGTELLQSLLVDGIINGVGAIITFIPLIAIFYFIFAILEDSGYLPRAAFIIDKFMHAFGLQGRSFLSLMLGFGCNIPAIMASRTLRDEQEKTITVLLSPLVPCEARLGVMVFTIGLFFTGITASLVATGLLAFNMFLVVIVALVLKKVVFRGEHAAFIMEMPPYRIPNLRTVVLTTWHRVKSFITRAASLIFIFTLLIWGLSTFPLGSSIEDSFAGLIGRGLQPFASLLGFDWRITLSLIFGFAAKELTISALGVIYGFQNELSLIVSLQQAWTPLIAITFTIFQMIYIPCLATISVIKKELNSWRWAFLAALYTLILGFGISLLVYNFGLLSGLG